MEHNYLNKIIQEVEAQNKEYFESKARELLRKQDHDLFAKASANLLFLNSSNIDREAITEQVQHEKNNNQKN